MGNFKNKLFRTIDKTKNKVYRFFYGRYGYDTLGKVLLWTYSILLLVYMILQLFIKNTLFNVLYPIAIFALVCYTLYRVMSRKIAKRRAENERFCNFFKLRRNKFRDRKTHVYRKCPDCKAVLRLPKSRGKHSVVCPRCKKRFEVKG